MSDNADALQDDNLFQTKMAPNIIKLDEDVINRIAAGEVIHRPCNALKELLENSIDAGATQITVVSNRGGMKLLQIQDNGHGIRKEDLPIVCRRFTTSKLRKFDDLKTITSFGFRGEALASVSHVAHLSITTRTEDDKCAYKAMYHDGELVASKPGGSVEPKPCAGLKGTQISMEDLFYNMASRKQALKNAAEQYQKILDVVARYAIHYGSRGIGFTCKKYRESSSDLLLPQKSTILDNIRLVYGPSVSKELVFFECSLGDLVKDKEGVRFQASGYISNANYSMKRSCFLLFINDRLVDCSLLKRSCEQVFHEYLPKNMHPFIYMGLKLPPETLDVNVHPTKREVHFLYDEEISNKIKETFEQLLLGANSSRTFLSQTLLPSSFPAFFDDENKVHPPSQATKKNTGDDEVDPDLVATTNTATATTATTATTTTTLSTRRLSKSRYTSSKAPQHLVRTDHKSTTMERFLSPPHSQFKRKRTVSMDSNYLLDDETLTSIRNLKSKMKTSVHNGLRTMLKEHTFVGLVDKELSLIQFRTKLFLVRHSKFISQLFTQQMIYHFGKCELIQLETPLNIEELALESLDESGGWRSDDGSKEEIAQEVGMILKSKRDMLNENFSIGIDDEGRLVHLPLLLDHYVPQICVLPEFVVRLAYETNWEEEQACFEDIASEIGLFYSNLPIHPSSLLEHVLYPALRNQLFPSGELTDHAHEVACLSNLYKIFERC